MPHDSNCSARDYWTELTPAERLAALYNRARPQGMGIFHFQPGDATPADMETVADGYVDYLRGRVIKTNVAAPESPSFHLFNRDNGQGAAEDAIRAAAEVKARTLDRDTSERR